MESLADPKSQPLLNGDLTNLTSRESLPLVVYLDWPGLVDSFPVKGSAPGKHPDSPLSLLQNLVGLFQQIRIITRFLSK